MDKNSRLMLIRDIFRKRNPQDDMGVAYPTRDDVEEELHYLAARQEDLRHNYHPDDSLLEFGKIFG